MLNYKDSYYSVISREFIKGMNRGPEFSVLDKIDTKLCFGFHRLAINGLNAKSNQPITLNEKENEDIVLICNGEIYNYKELYALMDITPKTDSDCEVIAHLYLKYGIEQTLTMLDGVFSFLLLDRRSQTLFAARDPYGVRPLYQIQNKNNPSYPLLGFASELKCLVEFYNSNTYNYSVQQFQPGTYSILRFEDNFWKPLQEEIRYFIPTFSYSVKNFDPSQINPEEYYKQISYYLESAVNKRCLATERPIACLLSGGLDSSLITALVNKFYKDNHYNVKLETYAIGLAGSEDLKYAKIVAEYLDTNHTEIIVTEKDMFEFIPEVIHAIESYDTTTVRASLGNYLVGKYISQNSDAKVIFNGDGSDELFGGYLYMKKCPDSIEFDMETRRLLKDIHLFDVLRSDKSISSHGLEPRTPFLDKSFVNYVLSLPPYFRRHTTEKFILRNSFTQENYPLKKQLLPDKILWRTKDAFSDGVSNKGRSLYTILQEQISKSLVSEDGSKYPVSIDTEKFYYKKLFLEFYPNCQEVLPYFWMPKYTNATDPSARTLDVYTA
jgi:asparagine synthase (glutamine-hydrolysing)